MGEPQPSDFQLAESEVTEPDDGEVVVRNTFMSVDPYMRGRMNDVPSYVPPWQLGQVCEGAAVGEVVASRDERFKEGDTVLHQLGWREYAKVGRGVSKVDVDGISPSAYLGVLGMPGLTAYAGLLDIAALKDGDIVFVSGAAGAVGSLAGQIAKLRGHTVVGSAGSADKIAWVTGELGFDAAFDYHDGVRDGLKRVAPDGIDVYFDNVGGEHLEAAISALKVHGRVALCGAISGYNATEPEPWPRNMALAIGKRLTLRGFIILDHFDRLPAFQEEVAPGVRDGRIKYRETVVEGGVEAAPQALIDLLRGANTGKMVVKL